MLFPIEVLDLDSQFAFERCPYVVSWIAPLGITLSRTALRFAQLQIVVALAIARLQQSQAHLADCERAMKDFQRHVKDPDLVSKTAKLTSGLTRQLRITSSENDLCYFQAIPTPDKLVALEMKMVVKEELVPEASFLPDEWNPYLQSSSNVFSSVE